MRKGFNGSLLWGGIGGAGSAVGVSQLIDMGTLHSGLLIPAVATSAVAVLGGMGAARGVFNGFEVLLVESRVVADSAIAAFTAVAPDDSALEELVKDGGKIQDQIDRFRSEEAQGYLNMNTGSGILKKIAMATFLPSQDILLEHILREVHLNDLATESGAAAKTDLKALVGGAASGVVAGFIEDWRDRATLLGVVFFLLAVAGLSVLDYMYWKAFGKKDEKEKRDGAADNTGMLARVKGLLPSKGDPAPDAAAAPDHAADHAGPAAEVGQPAAEDKTASALGALKGRFDDLRGK